MKRDQTSTETAHVIALNALHTAFYSTRDHKDREAIMRLYGHLRDRSGLDGVIPALDATVTTPEETGR